MKKLLSVGLSAVMLFTCSAALLSGCGEGGEVTGPSDYDHTIIFYSSQGDALQQKTAIAIENFETKYPGWKVQHTTQGGYDDVKEKIVQDLQANIQPDLAYCYADHVAQYLSTEQVIDMSKYINSTERVVGAEGVEYTVGYSAEELADFIPGYYAEGYATNFAGYKACGYKDDSILTLPFVKSTELLYYNEDALKACGLEPAKTWDEMWAQAPVIKAKFPEATVLGYDSEANWFITMCEQNGWGYTSADESQHFLFNSDNAALKSWLTSLNDYWNKGWLTTQADYGSYTSGLFTKGVAEGGCVYCIGSSGGASYQASNKFTAKIAAIPGSNNTEKGNAVISQGPSLVMFNAGYNVSNASEKAKMTFLFIKELLDPTFQAAFSIQAGYNPCRQSVYDIPAYVEHMSGTSMTAMACVTAKGLTKNFFTSPAFVGSSTARTQVGNVVLYVMTGQKDANKALADAYKNCGGK